MPEMRSSILNLIGKTPLLRLKSIEKNVGAQLLAKCEFMNPSGSIKDRIALQMINEAEEKGRLKRGYTIVESSTGNTGIALSFVGGVKGYKVHVFETMPGKMSRERVRIMQSYGAEVTLVTPKKINDLKERSVSGAEIEVPGRIMCRNLEKANPKVWWARQFSNLANVEAHHQTGREILEQTDGHVDVFVASIGTGGTLMGIAEVLKEKSRKVRIVGVQPASSKVPIKLGKSYARSEIVGGIICGLLEKQLMDDIVTVRDKDAIAATHRLRKREGLFVGVSSGANVLVAAKEGRNLGKNATVVTVLPDSGDRYLSQEHFVT